MVWDPFLFKKEVLQKVGYFAGVYICECTIFKNFKAICFY